MMMGGPSVRHEFEKKNAASICEIQLFNSGINTAV